MDEQYARQIARQKLDGTGLTLRKPLWHLDGLRIAMLRMTIDMRPTRVWESQ